MSMTNKNFDCTYENVFEGGMFGNEALEVTW